jgi:hypothetical protein
VKQSKQKIKMLAEKKNLQQAADEARLEAKLARIKQGVQRRFL